MEKQLYEEEKRRKKKIMIKNRLIFKHDKTINKQIKYITLPLLIVINIQGTAKSVKIL